MVLAAGLGTRLRPITRSVPKPMVPVLNRPVMEHILLLLSRQGFTEVVANLHWFPEVIKSHFGDGSRCGVGLEYSMERQLLGTAGGVRRAESMLGDSFLVISGDALTDIDLEEMRKFHESHDGVATLATRRVFDTSEFGVVITGEDGRIQGFQEKPEPEEALSDLANCGIYMFDREVFDFFPDPGASSIASPDDPDEFADWATDVFPAMLAADIPFYSHEVDAYWNDIGTIPELLQGSFDGLTGKVRLDIGLPEVAPSVWAPAGTDLSAFSVEGPVLIGEGASIGPGASLEGPLVVGRRAEVGPDSVLRHGLLLDDSALPAGSYLVGGLLGRGTA
jgi:mannose-1-phosphate guanylyltransferase/mannose-1-phosphate guanylyltransferase/phosphomannomutase